MRWVSSDIDIDFVIEILEVLRIRSKINGVKVNSDHMVAQFLRITRNRFNEIRVPVSIVMADSRYSTSKLVLV